MKPVAVLLVVTTLLFLASLVPAEIYTWGHSGDRNGGYHGYGYTEDSADFEHFPNNPLDVSPTKISIGGRGFWEIRNYEDATSFSSGSFALFLTADGSVYGYGYNQLGQLGISNRSINFAETIMPIPVGSPVKDIAAGNAHSVFLLQNGTVLVTGANTQSAMGFPIQNVEPFGTTHIRTPRSIALPGPATAICASFYRSFFVVGGVVYGLGCNREGRMGVGNTIEPFFADVQTLPLTNVTAISCSNVHAAALLGNGSVAIWGYDADAPIFASSTITRASSPIIVDTSIAGSDPIVEIATTVGRTIIRTAGGRVYYWPNREDQFTPTDATDDSLPSSPGAVGINGLGEYMGVLLADGSLYTFGEHGYAVAGTSYGLDPSCQARKFCVTRWSPTFTTVPKAVAAFALSNQWAAATDSTGKLWFAGKLRWAFSAVPKLADRWHRPGSPTYGKVIVQIGDSPNGPVYITSENELWQIGRLANFATPSDPEFAFEDFTLDPIMIGSLPVDDPPNGDMWPFANAGFDHWGGGLVTKSGKIWTWCENPNVCPGGSIPSPVDDLPWPVEHAAGLDKGYFNIIFVLRNGSVGIFGDPIPTYTDGSACCIASTQAAPASNPLWLNMTGTPSTANITKIVRTGGGLWGGVAFLFSNGQLWRINEPANRPGQAGFPSVAPIRVGSLFWSNIWADLNHNNGELVAITSSNDVYTIGEANTLIGRLPLIAADYVSDGFLGVQSNGNVSYSGGHAIDRGQFPNSWGWVEGIFPPMSGSPNWPDSERQRSGVSSITPSAFGGKKVKMIQSAGWRIGVVAVTEFFPEIDADTSNLLDATGSQFSLTVHGRYFYPFANNASSVSFNLNTTLFTCAISSYSATEMSVSCNRISVGSLSSTYLHGSVTRDGLTSSWTPVGVLNPPPPAAPVPIAPPVAPPARTPTAIPTASPAATPDPTPSASPTPVAATPRAAQPIGAPLASSSFVFVSAADLSPSNLVALASTLCNIAKQITNRTAIDCSIAASARRAAGQHTATLASGDAPTAAAVSANLALIQNSFLAAFSPAQIPANVPSAAIPSTQSVAPSFENSGGGSNVGLGVGLGVGIPVFVIIVIVIVVIFVIMTRKKRNNRDRSAPMEPVKPAAPPIYDNATVMEDELSSESSSSENKKKVKKPKRSNKKTSGSDSSSASDSSSKSESNSKSNRTASFKDDGVYAALPAQESRQHRAYSHWAIPFSELDLGKSIGRGSFGIVFKGKWRGVTVAIKECAITDPTTLKEFLAEAELMLQMRPNPNVVQVLGICVEGNKSYIIMEYLPRSLDKIVFDPKQRAELSDQEIVRYATDIARGMLHISAEKIVHRDLACRNILLSKERRAKISDFGMSRQLLDDAEGQTKTSFGPLAWMSPEAIRQKFSEKSDVWSYGIVLWEIVAGSLPHRNVDRLELPLMIRDQAYHPAIPERCPPVLRTVMEACWRKDPNERPGFSEILTMLRRKTKGKSKRDTEDGGTEPSQSNDAESESSGSEESS